MIEAMQKICTKNKRLSFIEVMEDIIKDKTKY